MIIGGVFRDPRCEVCEHCHIISFIYIHSMIRGLQRARLTSQARWLRQEPTTYLQHVQRRHSLSIVSFLLASRPLSFVAEIHTVDSSKREGVKIGLALEMATLNASYPKTEGRMRS